MSDEQQQYHNHHHHHQSRRLYRSVVEDYRRSSVQLASQVHKAIRDGDYDWLPEMVRNDNRILWEPNNSTGWTAVHFALSQPLPTEWLEWILVRAASVAARESDGMYADTSAAPFPMKDQGLQEDLLLLPNPAEELGIPTKSLFLTTVTCLGESPWDIFFKSYLNPMPWQSWKHESQPLKQALQQCLSSFSCVEDSSAWMLWQVIRQGLMNRSPAHKNDLQDTRAYPRGSTGQNNDGENDEQSSRTAAVNRVVRFLKHLALLGLATMGQLEHKCNDIAMFQNDDIDWISLLACTGCCPDIVARVVWALLRQPQQHVDEVPTSLALHIWACSQTRYCVNSQNDDPDMLPFLLEAFPGAPLQPYHGWLPLQLALTYGGKSWEQVQRLWKSAPFQTLTTTPTLPPQALPLIALVALRAPVCTPPMRARQRVVGKNGVAAACWSFLPGQKRKVEIEQAEKELNCEQLTTLYSILRADPQALGRCLQCLRTVA